MYAEMIACDASSGSKRKSTTDPETLRRSNSMETFGNISYAMQHGLQIVSTSDESVGKWLLGFLPVDKKIVVRGKLQLKCLIGQIGVNGCIVDRKSCDGHFVKLYSPISHAHATLTGLSEIRADLKDVSNLPEVVEAFGADNSDLQECLKKVHASAPTRRMSVFLAQRLDCSACNKIKQISSFYHLFKCSNTGLGKSFGFSFTDIADERNSRIFTESDELKSTTQQMNELAESESPSSLRTLVCGFKDSGKSSTVRYLINAMLSNSSSSTQCVAVLDCDIGQPEFTPSGIIGLTLVRRPLFGPPFTHQFDPELTPIRQCFVGSINLADDPTFYIDCLKFVFSAYQELDPKPPLFVNTAGWTQGLGLLLLVDTIVMVEPDLIVSLRMPNPKQNPPILNSDQLRKMQGWTVKDLSQQEFNHRLVVIGAPSKESFGPKPAFGAPDHRELTMLAYLFSRLCDQPTCLPPALLSPGLLTTPAGCLLALEPYRVPLNSNRLALRVMHPQEPIIAELLPMAFNASIVALCSVSEDMIEKSTSDLPSTLKSNPVCECLGLGIVRAVDTQDGVLFILTGLPQDRLAHVNALLKGVVDIPHCLLIEQPNADLAPYVEDPVNIGVGGKSLPGKKEYPQVRRHASHRGNQHN